MSLSLSIYIYIFYLDMHPKHTSVCVRVCVFDVVVSINPDSPVVAVAVRHFAMGIIG